MDLGKLLAFYLFPQTTHVRQQLLQKHQRFTRH